MNEEKIQPIEPDGAKQLYYALNKKMVEMAELLNATNLKSIDMADPKDKTFERIKVIWDSAAKVSEASKMLGQASGILKSDNSSENNRPFVDTIAESRK